MKQHTKMAVLALVAAGILIPTSLVLMNAGVPPLTRATPIDIIGNDQLAAASSSGNGTAGNPYVIEYHNWTGLDASVYVLRIQNTNAHVIVRDSLVHAGSLTTAGIYLSKTQHVTVSGVNITGGTGANYGIYIAGCVNTTIVGCTIQSFAWGSIITMSANTTMRGNAFGVGNTGTGSSNRVSLDITSATTGTFDGNWWADYLLRYPAATSDGATWKTVYTLPYAADNTPLVNNPVVWRW